MRNIWWAVRSSLCNQRSVCLRYPYSPPDVYISSNYLRSSPPGYYRRARRLAALYASHACVCTRTRIASLYPRRFYKFYDQISVDMFCRRRLKFSFYIFGAREISGRERERRDSLRTWAKDEAKWEGRAEALKTIILKYSSVFVCSFVII